MPTPNEIRNRIPDHLHDGGDASYVRFVSIDNPFSVDNPASLGTASPGTSVKAARADHVHTLPAVYTTDTQTAGETINGATLPVACFISDTDDEWYACDANDATKLKFNGFAISNGTDGNDITIQFNGIVSGFTGLTKGATYFVQDDKTLGTAVGTNFLSVGVAISATEILIVPPSKVYRSIENSSHAFGAGADTHILTINCGFRVKEVELIGSLRHSSATITADNLPFVGVGHCAIVCWSELSPKYFGAYWDMPSTYSSTNDGLMKTDNDAGEDCIITVDSITEIGFNLLFVKSGTDSGSFYWKFILKAKG